MRIVMSDTMSDTSSESVPNETQNAEPSAFTLPYLTVDLPGIGGRWKDEPEDFVVEEIPAYEPAGAGEHLFLWIEKRDVSAKDLVHHVGRTSALPA
jgi:tRNA pseudouridine13 synthase